MNKIKSKIHESTDINRNKQRNYFNPYLDTKKDFYIMANNIFEYMNKAITLLKKIIK